MQLNNTLTVGQDDTGYDVKLYGATSGKYWLWDESADGVVQYGTLTVGVDDTGYDVKFFGATASNYLLWDESADRLLTSGTSCTMALGSSAATAGSATALSDSKTLVLGVYADDGNAAVGSGTLMRAGRFRTLLTYTGGNREQEAVGAIGQLVVNAGTNRHNMAGLMGSYERTTGTVVVDGQAWTTDPWIQAGVIGRVGVGDGNTTINSNGVLCGLAAMSNTTALTNNGYYAGLFVSKWGQSGTMQSWSHGVLIDGGAVGTTGILITSGPTRAIDAQGKSRVGTHDWGVGAEGILLTGTDPDMVFEVAARINSVLDAGAYAAEYNQLACTAAQTGNVSTFASWNELYFTGTTAIGIGNAASVWGHIEISGTFTGPASTSNYMGSIVGTIMSDANTVTNAGIMGAFIADSLLTTGFTNNGKIAGLVVHVNDSHPTRANWPLAIYIDGADAVLGFGSGSAYEDGVLVSAITNVGGDAGHSADGVMKVYVGATAYYIPIYAAGSLVGE